MRNLQQCLKCHCLMESHLLCRSHMKSALSSSRSCFEADVNMKTGLLVSLYRWPPPRLGNDPGCLGGRRGRSGIQGCTEPSPAQADLVDSLGSMLLALTNGNPRMAVVLTPEFHTLGDPLPAGPRTPEPPQVPSEARSYKALVMVFLHGGAFPESCSNAAS